MQITEADDFKKSFKKLRKKYKILETDFENLLDILRKHPEGVGSKHWNILKLGESTKIFKTRMMCRSVKGSSFRIIYFYDGKNIEIIFIEIYFKGKKINENKAKINEFWNEYGD